MEEKNLSIRLALAEHFIRRDRNYRNLERSVPTWNEISQKGRTSEHSINNVISESNLNWKDLTLGYIFTKYINISLHSKIPLTILNV